MSDRYWNSEVITRIDLEATTGKIPVSGTGQGDPHRGSGNDGIRFGHFHIVGPAQNLLYESTADAIGVQLGRRAKVLTFDDGKILTPAPRLIGLKTPLLLDVMPMDGGEGLLEAMFEAAKTVGTRLTLRLDEADRYGAWIRGRFDHLILRLTALEAKLLMSGKKWPEAFNDRRPDLIEIEVTEDLLELSNELRAFFSEATVLSAVIRVRKEDIDAELRPVPALRRLVEDSCRIAV